WKTCFGEFHVAAKSVINSRRASDLVGSRPDGIDLTGEYELFNFLLDLVIQLVTVVPEKFDAVVLIRIMRSGKHDTGVGAQRSRDVSDTRRRQRSDDEDIHSERSDSRHQGVCQHVT